MAMGGLRNFFEDFLASLDHAESADAIWTAALDAIGRVPVSGEVHVFYRDTEEEREAATAPSTIALGASHPAGASSVAISAFPFGQAARDGAAANAGDAGQIVERPGKGDRSTMQAIAITVDDAPCEDMAGLPVVRDASAPDRGVLPGDFADDVTAALDDSYWIYLSAVMHFTYAYLEKIAGPAPKRLRPALSGRQADVLAGLAAGKRQKEIAYDLGISENTVAYHAARLRQRLGCSHSNEIVAAAYLSGLLRSPDPRRS